MSVEIKTKLIIGLFAYYIAIILFKGGRASNLN